MPAPSFSATSLLICTDEEASTWYYVQDWTEHQDSNLPTWVKDIFDGWNNADPEAVAGAYVFPNDACGAGNTTCPERLHLYLINIPGVQTAVSKRTGVGRTDHDIEQHNRPTNSLSDWSIVLRDAEGQYYAMPRGASGKWDGTCDPGELGDFTTRNMQDLIAGSRLATKQEPPPGTVDTHSVNCYLLNLRSFT